MNEMTKVAVEKGFYLDLKMVDKVLGAYYENQPNIKEYLLAIDKGNVFTIGKVMQHIASMVGSANGVQAHLDFINDYNEIVKPYTTFYQMFFQSYSRMNLKELGMTLGMLESSGFEKTFPLFLKSELDRTFVDDSADRYDHTYRNVEFSSESILEFYVAGALEEWYKPDGSVSKQVNIEGGRLDILVNDFSENRTLIIELKKGVGDLKAIEQILRYRNAMPVSKEDEFFVIASSFTEEAIKYSELEGIKCVSFNFMCNEIKPIVLFDQETSNFNENCDLVYCLQENFFVEVDYTCHRNNAPSLKKTNKMFHDVVKRLESFYKKEARIEKNSVAITIGGTTHYVSHEDAANIRDEISNQLISLKEVSE